MNKPLPERIEEIAIKLQTISGLKKMYIVRRDPLNNTFLWFIVKEFHEDHFELADGSLYPYQSFSGYVMPPSDIIEKMRAKENGIDLNPRKIITN